MTTPEHTAPLDADQISALIPHAGSMCLLQRVLAFDDVSIRCETRSHLDPDNPLRHNGRLSSVCGIEYAAQAMALHGALKASAMTCGREQHAPQSPAAPRHGYLASVRDTNCSSRYLDDNTASLMVSAELVFEQASRVIYAFAVAAGDRTLIAGRAAVVLG